MRCTCQASRRSTAARATSCSPRKSICGAASRRWPCSAAGCLWVGPSPRTTRSTSGTPPPTPGRPVRLPELFEEGKDTLFLYNHMFIPGNAGRPLEQGCPLCTSIIDGIDGAVPAHQPADQLRGGGEAAHRAVSCARPGARLATRPAPLIREQHIQPRLFRRGRRWWAARCGDSLRPARREDPSLVDERIDVDRQRARPGSPPRRLHVADVGGDRPQSRWEASELGSQAGLRGGGPMTLRTEGS